MRFLFPGQQPNEKIHLLIREHWFVLASRLLIWVIFIAILFILDNFGPKYFSIVFQPPYLYYFNLFKNLYTIFLMLGLLITVAIYYLNYQIVTSERIVDVTQTNLFHHTISEMSCRRIQDVTSETKGMLGTIFGYGNVYVQTAGERERFTFPNIPDPEKTEKLIINLLSQNPPPKTEVE